VSAVDISVSVREAWSRPYYRTGGGDAFLFYVVFGRFSADLNARASYRTRGLPEGVEAFKNPEPADEFRTGVIAKQLVGTAPALRDAVLSAPDCLVVRGSIPDPSDLLYLRDVVGILTAALDSGGVGLLDATTINYWDPADWRRRCFHPDAPVPTEHVIIYTSQDENRPKRQWFHTRGMRKFGRPDIGVYGVPGDESLAVTEMCNRFISIQAFGEVVEEGLPIRMRGLPDGMRCHRVGSLDDVDYNNVHIAIDWP
jgi:hypothetical protein